MVSRVDVALQITTCCANNSYFLINFDQLLYRVGMSYKFALVWSVRQGFILPSTVSPYGLLSDQIEVKAC